MKNSTKYLLGAVSLSTALLITLVGKRPQDQTSESPANSKISRQAAAIELVRPAPAVKPAALRQAPEPVNAAAVSGPAGATQKASVKSNESDVFTAFDRWVEN